MNDTNAVTRIDERTGEDATQYECRVSSDPNGNCVIHTPNGSVITCQSGGVSLARRLMQAMATGWEEQGRQRGLFRASCRLTGDQLDILVMLGEDDARGQYREAVVQLIERHLGREAACMLRVRVVPHATPFTARRPRAERSRPMIDIEYDSHGYPTSSSLTAIADWAAERIGGLSRESNDDMATYRRLMDRVNAVRSGATARDTYGERVSKSVDIERRRALSDALEAAKGLLIVLRPVVATPADQLQGHSPDEIVVGPDGQTLAQVAGDEARMTPGCGSTR